MSASRQARKTVWKHTGEGVLVQKDLRMSSSPIMLLFFILPPPSVHHSREVSHILVPSSVFFPFLHSSIQETDISKHSFSCPLSSLLSQYPAFALNLFHFSLLFSSFVFFYVVASTFCFPLPPPCAVSLLYRRALAIPPVFHKLSLVSCFIDHLFQQHFFFLFALETKFKLSQTIFAEGMVSSSCLCRLHFRQHVATFQLHQLKVGSPQKLFSQFSEHGWFHATLQDAPAAERSVGQPSRRQQQLAGFRYAKFHTTLSTYMPQLPHATQTHITPTQHQTRHALEHALTNPMSTSRPH